MRLKSITLLFFAHLILLGTPARAQAHAVSLTWTASTDGGVSYNIYRFSGACPSSGTSGFSKITGTPVSGTAYTDSTVAAGTYCYYATSVLNGAESAPSNLASAVILPASPTALSIARTN
jgi:fibronectin type 3 domain-containing protein